MWITKITNQQLPVLLKYTVLISRRQNICSGKNRALSTTYPQNVDKLMQKDNSVDNFKIQNMVKKNFQNQYIDSAPEPAKPVNITFFT